MRLILKNFKKLVVQHTGLFLLLFISIAFSVFGVLFLSGYSAYSHCCQPNKDDSERGNKV